MQNSSNTNISSSQESLLYFISYFIINGSRSQFSQYFQFICAEIQLLAMIVWTHMTYLAFDNYSSGTIFLRDIPGKLVITNIFDLEKDYSVLLVLSIIIWLYLITLCLFLGYLGFKAYKRQKINSKAQTWVSSIVQFHSGSLFWIFNIILMTTIIACKKQSIFLGQDLLFKAMNLIFILLNYAFGLLGAICCFDPFSSTNIFAVRTPTFQVCGFICKAILAPLVIFTDSNDLLAVQIVFMILSLMITTSRIYSLFHFFPFFYYKPMKIAIAFTVIGFWISVINIPAIIFQKTGSSPLMSTFYLILLPLPILIKLTFARLMSIINFYTSLRTGDIQKKQQVYKKLFALRYMADKITLSINESQNMSPYELYFLGNLIEHSKTCDDAQCFCHSFVGIEDPTLRKAKNLLPVYFSTSASSLLTEVVGNFKNNSDLKIALANLIFTRAAKGLTAALIYLFSTPRENLGFFMRVRKHIISRKVQERMIEYFNGNGYYRLNIVKFTDYQASSLDFLTRITDVTETYLKFWESFKTTNLKINEILGRSNYIEKEAEKIDMLWESGVEKYEPFYHEMKNQYRLYLSLVRNLPSTSHQIINKLKWKKLPPNPDPNNFEFTEDDINSSKVLTVHLAMSKEKIGRVNYVSENILEFTGISSKEVVGKSINVMMPACIAENHDRLLLRNVDRLKGNSPTQDCFTEPIYVKTKAGHIVPCLAHVTLFPYIQNELVYTGIVKPTSQKFDYLLLDNMGYVDAYTERIGRKVQLSPDKRSHIKDICPDIFKSYAEATHKSDPESPVYKNQPLNLMEEVKILDTVILTTTLIFNSRDKSHKTYRYSSTLIRKNLIQKCVYILQLEPDYESLQSRKRTPNLVQVGLSRYIKEELDLPGDVPISAGVPMLPQLKQAVFDGMQNSETIFKKQMLVVDQVDSVANQDISTNTQQVLMITEEVQQSQPVIEANSSSTEINEKKMSDKQGKSSISTIQNEHEKMASEAANSVASTTDTTNTKLENAIYSLPNDKSISALKILSWMLNAFTVLLLLILYIETNRNLDLVNENISFLKTSSLRLFYIAELNRRTRIVSLFQYGLIDDQRYSQLNSSSSLLPDTLTQILQIEQSLVEYNQLVRTAMETIDVDLQRELFESEIPVISPDTEAIQYSNIFDATTILTIQAKQLAITPADQLSQGSSYINFILNNTMTGQLIVSEKVIGIILKDNDTKLKAIEDLAIYFIAIMFCLCVVVVVSLIYKQRKFIKSRNRLIEIFLRLDEDEVEEKMTTVKAFRNSLLNNRMNFKDVGFDDTHIIQKSKVLTAGKSGVKNFNARMRSPNMKGINIKIIVGQALMLFIFVITEIPFMSINLTSKTTVDQIQQDITEMITISNNLYEITLLMAEMYEYIQLDGTTTVRNEPINEDYETTLEQLSISQTVFSGMLNEQNQIASKDKETYDQLNRLFTGNLCTALTIPSSYCLMATGNLEKGLIGANSFTLLTLQSLKNMYDASSKTFDDAKDILSNDNIVVIEYLYNRLQVPAYQKVGDILESHIDKHVSYVNKAVLITVIVSITLGLILSNVFSSWLWKIVETERINWRKLLRKVPFNIAISNKGFKNYIAMESSHRFISKI